MAFGNQLFKVFLRIISPDIGSKCCYQFLSELSSSELDFSKTMDCTEVQCVECGIDNEAQAQLLTIERHLNKQFGGIEQVSGLTSGKQCAQFASGEFVNVKDTDTRHRLHSQGK